MKPFRTIGTARPGRNTLDAESILAGLFKGIQTGTGVDVAGEVLAYSEGHINHLHAEAMKELKEIPAADPEG